MGDVRFGYCLPIFANPSAGLFRTPNLERVDARQTLALGVHADDLGFDSLWVADHLMLGRDEAVLEGWTMLSALGAMTSRARIGMIHQGHFFRSPGVAAKAGATLDQVTNGRFILFYDPGHQAREHRAYHLHYPDDEDERIDETLDGLQTIRDLWQADSRVSAESGIPAVCRPAPVQQPHPPLWFGETHSDLLAACAAYGQGWNTTPCSVDEFGRRLDLLRHACQTAGRNPDEIDISIELQVLVAPADDVRSQLARLLEKVPDPERIDADVLAFAQGIRREPPRALTDTTLVGSPSEVRGQLAAYIDRGAGHFLLWFLDAPDRSGMELFAREVAPQVRTARTTR
jgi:alkanesulfonate monooxygenase SsuD/methylene tetrahydromethanopterin reductase-like flavin-dependent oxidoreductase (luciferase family)